ncbi:MAG: peptidoglycan-associated lipoprotein Pal [Pseudomonadota bacterium]
MAFGLNKKSGLKLLGAASAMLMVSACTNTSGPDVVATGPDTSTVADRIIPGSQEDLEQSAGHRVFFGYDKYSLSPQAQATLARQAQWLKANPGVSILIAGNCDERGTREYNLALGARRAQSARSFLISNGIDGSRVRTVSYGKERPLDPRSTSDAWSLNRNSTTTIVAAGV